MRLAYVCDFTPATRQGGAEMNGELVCAALAKAGHTVEQFGLVRVPGQHEMFDLRLPPPQDIKADALLLGNVMVLPPRWVMEVVEHFAFDGKPIVMWVHSLPWCPSGTQACNGRTAGGQHPDCRWGFYDGLVRQCDAFLCYTPMAERIFREAFEYSKRTLHVHVPPLLLEDPDAFYAQRKTAKDPHRTLYVGRLSPAKGTRNLAVYAHLNPEQSVVAIGSYDREARAMLWQPNVTFTGELPLEMLPAEYGKSGRFFHQPNGWDAVPRTLVEARLAGCELIASGMCGAFSHPDWALSDEDLVARIRTAPDAWAKTIIDSMGGTNHAA